MSTTLARKLAAAARACHVPADQAGGQAAAAAAARQSQYEPAGDQPTAIRELTAGVASGERDQVLLGVTGSGKTFTMAKVIEAAAAPDPDPGAEQDPGRPALRRDEAVLPGQRGRILRQLLRLLPAGSLRSAHRHLYRKRQPDQRADRAHAPQRHPRPARARRRRHRRLRLLHLRYRLGRDLWPHDRQARSRRLASTATPWPAPWSSCNTAATTPPSSAAPSACAARPSTCSPATSRTAPGASPCSATRSRASASSIR